MEAGVLDSPNEADDQKKRQRRYDWRAIEDAFFLSSFESFQAFLKAAGYPDTLRKSKWARGIAERKLKLLEHAQKSLVPAHAKNPLSETLDLIEAAKRSSVKEFVEYSKSASAIRFACDLTLKAHLELARQKPGEGKDQWIKRVSSPSISNALLCPTDLACIATAVHRAQDMTRNIVTMDESDWNDKLNRSKEQEQGPETIRITVVNPEALPEPAPVEALSDRGESTA